MLKFLLEKEFKQFFRDPFLKRLVLMFPIMLVGVIPWIVTMDIKNVQVAVVDDDRSTTSRRLLHTISASPYFELVEVPMRYDDALRLVEYGKADLILEVPYGFESDLLRRTDGVSLQVSANSVNGTRATLGNGYLTRLLADFCADEAGSAGFASGNAGFAFESAESDRRMQVRPKISLEVKNQFNALLDSKRSMVPGFMVMLLVLLCGFLPALNIVGEKERGTIEQINVTPVGKFTFILAKLIPYWLIGLLALSFAFLLAFLIYGLYPAGNIGTIYFGAMLFILTMSGVGVLVSNYAGTMQQAMFVMWFFIMICILMSGILTPVQSMPAWAQYVSACTPPHHLVKILRMVYLKGSTLADLWLPLSALSAMAVVANSMAVWSYRKRG